MKGLLGNKSDGGDTKLTANANLIRWLEEEGEVYLSETSTWGDAPHPMAISTDTKDEITNESSGRGLLARRDINDGDELLMIPLKLCITKKSARKAFGKDVLSSDINEYLAMACQLIRERFVMGDQSFYKPYIDVLPEVGEVNPTFTWSEEDLSFLQGSPVIAATKSLQMKLRREYDSLLGGEDGLIAKFPDKFPKEAFTFEHWEWAFTMLFSRAIRLRNLRQGESLALVPYADLINHSCFSQAYIDAREAGDWLFKTGEEEIILYADRGYRRMEQVCLFDSEYVHVYDACTFQIRHSCTVLSCRSTLAMGQSRMQNFCSCMALLSKGIHSIRSMSLYPLLPGLNRLSRKLLTRILRWILSPTKRLNS